MPSAGFELAIPAIDRAATDSHIPTRPATRIGGMFFLCANSWFPASPPLNDTSHFVLLSKDIAEKGLITLHSM
jgi:hypothetical protein